MLFMGLKIQKSILASVLWELTLLPQTSSWWFGASCPFLLDKYLRLALHCRHCYSVYVTFDDFQSAMV